MKPSKEPSAQLPLPPNEGHWEGTLSVCDRFGVLDVCEYAHREVAERPLALADQDFNPEPLRRHLQEERCPVCQRWYRNARRTYLRLQRAGKLPQEVSTSVERPVQARAWAARGDNHFLQPVRPAEKAGGLNALRLVLDCRQTGVTTPSNPLGWELTLVHLSSEHDPDGNAPEVLREYDDCLVTFLVQPRQGEPFIRETRLGLDDQGNLVSSPCSLEGIEPGQVQSVSLLRCEKRSPRSE